MQSDLIMYSRLNALTAKITLNNSMNIYTHLNSGFKNFTFYFTLLLYSQSCRDQATRTPIAIGHFTSYGYTRLYTRYKKCETRSKQDNRICIMVSYITAAVQGRRGAAERVPMLTCHQLHLSLLKYTYCGRLE